MVMTKKAWETRRKNGNGTAWNKGLKVTNPETLKRLREARLGKKLTPEQKLKISEGVKKNLPSTAKKNGHSLETRKKISMGNSGEKNFTGFKKNFNFRLRATRQYLQWRSDVFKRDNYHCQECGEKGYLEAHHIIPLSEIIMLFNVDSQNKSVNCKELWDIGNGISYCKKCHGLKDNARHIGIKVEVSA